MLNTVTSTNSNTGMQWAIDQTDSVTTSQPTISVNQQQSVAVNVENNRNIAATNTNGQVALPPPTVKADPDSLYVIMATLENLLTDHFSSNTRNNVKLRSELTNTAITNLQGALKAVNQAKANLTNAQNALTEATRQLADAKDVLGDKSAATIAAQNQLELSTAYLETIKKNLEQDPDNPLIQEKYQQASAAVANDERALTAAQADENTALQNYDIAINNGNNAATAALAAQQQVVDATNDYLSISNFGPLTAPDNQEFLSAMMVLMMAMAEFSEVLGDVESNKIRNSNKLSQDLQELRIQDCKRVAAEYQRAVDEAATKQERRNKVLKALNWVIAVTAFVAAAGTGGASLALATAALALCAVDTGMEAQGKPSPTAKMMEWAQDNIIQPMITKIADSIVATSANKKHPINKNLANLFATVLTMTTLMAASTVAAGGASMAMGAAARAIVPAQTLAALGKMGQMYSAPAIKLAISSTTLGVSLTSVTVTSVMDMAIARHTESAKNFQGDMTMINADLRLLQDMIDQLISQYLGSHICNDMAESVSTMISDFNSTTAYMTRRIPLPA